MIVPPPPPVTWAVLLAVAFPAVLLILSHGPFRIAALGRRFAAAWAGLLVAWSILVLSLSLRTSGPADYAAALMLFGAAIPLSFMWWSVLCWGFTLNMLVRLAGTFHPVSRAEWERGYAGPDGLTHLIEDRAGLLFRTGLAVPGGDKGPLRLTGRGSLAAKLAEIMRHIFSVRL